MQQLEAALLSGDPNAMLQAPPPKQVWKDTCNSLPMKALMHRPRYMYQLVHQQLKRGTAMHWALWDCDKAPARTYAGCLAGYGLHHIARAPQASASVLHGPSGGLQWQLVNMLASGHMFSQVSSRVHHDLIFVFWILLHL